MAFLFEYPYSSLIRFLKLIEVFNPTPIISKTVVSKPKKELKPAIVYDKLESKQVHFKKEDPKHIKRPRPATPENCFWED